MARSTTPEPATSGGDTPKQIEDKVRALPANQGKNDYDMWQLIDAEIAQARANSTLKENAVYKSGNIGDKHGNK